MPERCRQSPQEALTRAVGNCQVTVTEICRREPPAGAYTLSMAPKVTAPPRPLMCAPGQMNLASVVRSPLANAWKKAGSWLVSADSVA